MNGKRLIDLSVSGDLRPEQAVDMSTKVTRLALSRSKRNSPTSSVGSHVTISSINDGSYTPSSLYSSRITTAVSRGTSAVSRSTSAVSQDTTAVSRGTSTVSPGTTAANRSTSVASRTTTDDIRDTTALSRETTAVSRGTSTVRNISWRRRSAHKTRNLSNAVPGLLSAPPCISTELSFCLIGLTVWRMEDHVLHRLSINENGFFHQANCYLVHQSDEDGSSFLHVWSGSQSHQADRDAVKMHANKLDISLGGTSFMSFEFEGHETPNFLRHFQDGIVIVEGKSKQSLRRAVKYMKRLYRVHGRTHPSAACIECSVKAAMVNEVLILDGYPRMYVWVGQDVDFVLRAKASCKVANCTDDSMFLLDQKAIKLAKKIRTWQRSGKGHIIVVDQNNKQMSDAFLRKLDSDKQFDLSASEIVTENVTNYKLHLYKINGDRVLYDMPLVATQPLQQKYLTTLDSFLLDMGVSCPLYIWVGNSADPESLYGALHCAENFKQHHNYPYSAAICRVMEGSETVSFKRAFIDWKDRVLKGSQAVKSYHITNIERALFSKTDHHTVAKLTEILSHDNFLAGHGTAEMWQVAGDILKNLPQEQHGVFYNSHCYIILYTENISGREQHFIYFWVGSKTSKESQNKAQKLALAMDSVMGHRTTIIRILDGREPQHFLLILQRSIIVYDLDLGQDNFSECNDGSINNSIYCKDICMFSVQELASECVRVSQVFPVATSLNSSAAYVIIADHKSMLWFGKNAGACEREYSKNMLAYFCPERIYDYDIIIEGRESATFWSLVQQIGVYPKQFPKHILLRQSPTLTLCAKKLGSWSFTDIPNFSQEDLCDRDIFILDMHDQIQLWIGSSVLNREHEMLSEALKTYMDLDSARQKENDIQILFCNQDHEPSIFIKHFKSWDLHGYGGEQAYEAARKQLRQENANIDIDCQMIDMVYMDTTKISYKDLVKEKNLPTDIDMRHKEYYLSDAEFTRVLRMTRDQFYKLPIWKQQQMLKSARLVPDSNNLHITLSHDLKK